MKKILFIIPFLFIFLAFSFACDDDAVYNSYWSYTETTHFHEQKNGDGIKDEAEHVFNKKQAKKYGEKWYDTDVCGVCGYTKKGEEISSDKVCYSSGQSYDSLKEAITSNVSNPCELFLLKDLSIAETISISGGNISFNLNGFKITSSIPACFLMTKGVFSVSNGEIEVEGKAFRVDGKTNDSASETVLNLEDDLQITSSLDCCVFIYGKATLNSSATLTSSGVYATIQGNGNLVNAGTVVNILGGNVVADNSIAIYIPQGSTVLFSGGEIKGQTALYIKSGVTTITGGTFIGNGEYHEYDYNGSGAEPTGEAVVVDTCNYPGGNPVVLITGGTFISSNNNAIGSYAISGLEPLKNFIKGGMFSSDVSEYLYTGYVCLEENEMYSVNENGN